MAFLETPRFPLTVAFHAIGGPGYLTQVAMAASGFEQRLSLWQYARGSWDVGNVPERRPLSQQLSRRADPR
jgi:uncharacterized protein (TIGR02217 family)